MDLEKEVMTRLKSAMKAKDTLALEALRALKSAILLAKTASGNSDEISESQALKLVQKLVKQRKDSAALFMEQNREDLAKPELAQAEVISQFLPKQLDEKEIESIVKGIIEKTGANSMKDMGKVMGMANKEMAGKADGSTISKIVKAHLG